MRIGNTGFNKHNYIKSRVPIREPYGIGLLPPDAAGLAIKNPPKKTNPKKTHKNPPKKPNKNVFFLNF
jgi:hypothetical protein